MYENTLNEQLKKRDLEVFLELNKKAIEIETEVADQNEEIILKLDKVIKQVEDTNKDIFKIQVLFITGILSLIIQIIQMFIKK